MKGFILSQAIIGRSKAGSTAFAVLGAITFCHLLNDVMQSLLPTIYPLLKSSFSLSFGQIGFLTLVFNVAASLLQPFIGFVTDRRPQPYTLPLGMGCTLLGLVTLAYAPSYPMLLAGGALLGVGSAIFHPSRPASRGWPRGERTDSRNRCFRSAETLDRRWARCWRRS